MRKIIGFTCLIILSAATESNENTVWDTRAKTAISLSYDDALDSQLDTAVPALNRYRFKASFYLTLSSPAVNTRQNEWKLLAAQGHELGNHSIFHPCRASLANRDWVKPERDLDKISANAMAKEIIEANRLLFDIDGKTERTFMPPCGDRLAMGENYLDLVDPLFVAIKGEEENVSMTALLMPYEVTGKELIHFVKQHTRRGMLINIIFHGIGGDHLPVSEAAHLELLNFLHTNASIYWVDTYLNIMKSRTKAPQKK